MIKKLINLFKTNYLIISILILAIVFRFIGVYPGYPSHTDEAGYSSALTMILNGNLDPGRYDYPSGVPFIHYTLFKLLLFPFNWMKYYAENLTQIVDGFIKLPLRGIEYTRVFQLDIVGISKYDSMYFGRYVTAFFGVGIVFLIFLLVKKNFDKVTALVAAFLIATNFRQILNSHIGLPDIYNAFFLTLAVIVILKLLKKPVKSNYFLVGLTSAFYFSIKFQVFTLLPFFIAHVFASWDRSSNFLRNLAKIFFSKYLLLGLVTFMFTITLLNPYILLKFETFYGVQKYQMSKYGSGANSLDVYALSYLYRIGIGKIISIMGLLGILVGFVRRFKVSFILMITILQFMYVFVYYSRGGFYTRNFITITPLILIFSAISMKEFIYLFFGKVKWKFLSSVLLVALVSISSLENLKNSLVVIKEYTKVWNQDVLSGWIVKNIPKGTVVSAHGNTPLPQEGIKRMPYETDVAFSICEFAKDGADYAISNSAWATSSFYWWMGGSSDTKDTIKHYWNKPLDILEYSYPALALRELSQFAVFSIMNPWQAPDVDFVVAKIPKYTILSKKKYKAFDFNNDTDGWKEEGGFWFPYNMFEWDRGTLRIKEESLPLPSARWESPPIDINNWQGFYLEYRMKSQSDVADYRTGYVFTSFYKTLEDAEFSRGRTGLRLSERNSVSGIWVDKNLVGIVPTEAKYMRISFANYNAARSEVVLDRLTLYKANVNVDFSGVEVSPAIIDQNNLFPNSHGNL